MVLWSICSTDVCNQLWLVKWCMVMKWAVMVAFGEGDWMYVTERTDDYGNLTPVLFDTHQAAEDFASIYKHHKIVEYTCK